MIYYSPSTNGFYDTGFANYDVPDDAVEITPEERQALLDAQSKGQQIQAGADGKPEAVDRVVDTVAVLKAQATESLKASDIQVLRCYEQGIPLPAAWMAYRSALRVTASTGLGVLPSRPEWP
jgi:hypothetical protein